MSYRDQKQAFEIKMVSDINSIDGNRRSEIVETVLRKHGNHGVNVKILQDIECLRT